MPREPEISPRTIGPQEISASKLVVRLMRDTLDSQKVQFGTAIPDPQLIPVQKLGRILAGACRSQASESAGYATSPCHKQLRSQIARWMLKAGCTLNPEELTITTDASEAVFLALQVLCKPGDAVAIGRYFPAGTRVTRPAGGFLLWLELPGDVDTMVLYDHTQSAKIAIAPGRIFSTGDRYRNCLRLNGALWSEENRWAVESLGEMAAELCLEKA